VLVQTALGPVVLTASDIGLRSVRYADHDPAGHTGPLLDDAAAQLQEYLAGRRRAFDLPLDWTGMTDFQAKVLKAVATIPYGETRWYVQVAEAIDRPTAVRAVGGALARNPLPIVLPCHRVLPVGGGLAGYGGSERRGGRPDVKQRLLNLERAFA